jgi:hypothetical protein
MSTNKPVYKHFSSQDIQNLDIEMKVGLMATVTPEGLPHITLISTLQPCSESQLSWGQFTEGNSKKNIIQNPKTGFLIMTLDSELWRGKADWKNKAKSGKEYDKYNNTNLFRYNAYFGVHTVYYMDLVEQYGKEALPMGKIVWAEIRTIIARLLQPGKSKKPVINTWTRQLTNKLDNLKFLSYIGEDGYPVIIPAIQLQTLDSEHIIFSAGAYSEELRAIPEDTPMSVFVMSLDMEDVLLRGNFQGITRIGGVSCGAVKVEWVYNPMPPTPQQIYPPVKVEAVTDF